MKKYLITITMLLAAIAQTLPAEDIAADGSAVVSTDKLTLLNDGYELPPGGTLIGPSEFSERYAGGKHPRGSFSKVSIEADNLTSAVEVAVTSEPGQPWDAQILEHINAPVKKGDTLFVSLLARTVSAHDETGEGKVTIFAQLNRAPHTKFLYNTVSVGRKWSRFYYPFKADRDYPKGSAAFGVMFGYRIQTVQVADLKLYNYGEGRKLQDFPVTFTTYSGAEASAPWRKAAAERINTHRKADLNVVVKDAAGKPVKDAQIHAAMQRHAFHFGSAISARELMQQSADGEQYRRIVEKYFTMVVFENDLKWHGWEDTERRQVTLQALKWLEHRNIAVRGHCLIWPSWKHTPRDLQSLKENPEALSKRISDHIKEESGMLKGRIYEWDVINEPYSNHDVMDVLGRDSMISWFKLAHECDPGARLFLNDYSILSAGGSDYKHQNHFEETIGYLIKGGAPISGIGLQSHFGTDTTPPAQVYSILERFSKFGLPMAITEHDINTTDYKLHSAYTRDFMTITFSHPQVESFLSWGFWAGRHWRPDSAYYDKEWNLKPAGEVWLNMLTKEWWTDEKLKSSAQGTATTRAFLGDYTITVTHDGKTVKKDVKLTRESNEISVQL